MLFIDANVILAIHLGEAMGSRVRAYLVENAGHLLTSDFVVAECASAVSVIVRTGRLDRGDARTVLTKADAWLAEAVRIETLRSTDILVATSYLRRLDLTLRTADAINIATAARLQAELVTFDRRMADCARVLGVAAVEP